MPDVPVVLLCGGRGMRLREVSESTPKPLVEIGGKPILWHVMRTYAAAGFRRFVLCLGYKGDKIRSYFAGLGPDSGFDTITFADTGDDSETGERLRQAEKHVSAPTFFLGYADGVSDVSPAALLAEHRSRDRRATMTCVRPSTHYGVVEISPYGSVASYQEKPSLDVRVNGGFFCFDREVFSCIREGEVLEREPMQRLIAAGQLTAYVHDGFWACMDTPKDHQRLNDLWARGEAPWAK